MLSVEDVIFRYGGLEGRGVGPLSFGLSPGECLGLLGPSGCGKSTLLRVIAGLLPRDARDYFRGTVVWDGEVASSADSRRMSLMFQQTLLLPHMTVLENVLLPFLGDAEGRRRATTEAERLLNEVGIRDEKQFLPEALSGGMRTRVALARALVTRPAILLLDEPFSGLDVAVRESAYNVIEEARKRDRSGTILVSHDLEEAWRLCGRVAVMNSRADRLLSMDGVQDRPFVDFRDSVLRAMRDAKEP